jgi:hypothetical protein
VDGVDGADKTDARAAAQKAVRDGVLKRGPCEDCGDPDTEAHHDDYSRPLDVRWLCRRHHSDWHRDHPPVPGVTRAISTRLDHELAGKVAAICEAERRTPSNLIRAVVSIALEGVEPSGHVIEDLRRRLGLPVSYPARSFSVEAPGAPASSASSGGSAVSPSAPPGEKAAPARARRRAGRASQAKVRLLSGGECRHGTPHCRICGTGRYAS